MSRPGSAWGAAWLSDTCCHSLPGRCHGLPPLSATFDGLQDVTDAQMPLRMFLTRVLEQCVVLEDVTTSLSTVPARSGGAALPVSRLGDKALRVASVTFRACCGAVVVNRVM